MTEKAIRVLIADDQPLVRQGLRAILQGQDTLKVVGEAVDGADAVFQVERHRPDVVLMDINMPRMSGLDATQRICAGDRRTGVIVLTVYDDDETLFSALRAGANGFLLKDAPIEKVVEAIQQVASGEALLSPEATRRLLREFSRRPAPGERGGWKRVSLTGRERDVLDLIVRGHTNDEVAQQLYVQSSTVKTHIQSLYRKLGVRDRAQIVIFAYENGLAGLRPPPPG